VRPREEPTLVLYWGIFFWDPVATTHWKKVTQEKQGRLSGGPNRRILLPTYLPTYLPTQLTIHISFFVLLSIFPRIFISVFLCFLCFFFVSFSVYLFRTAKIQIPLFPPDSFLTAAVFWVCSQFSGWYSVLSCYVHLHVNLLSICWCAALVSFVWGDLKTFIHTLWY